MILPVRLLIQKDALKPVHLARLRFFYCRVDKSGLPLAISRCMQHESDVYSEVNGVLIQLHMSADIYSIPRKEIRYDKNLIFQMLMQQ